MSNSPENIILIILDAASANHCSCYGYQRETTPNLQRIADKGVKYESAIANSLWTLPAHASLATGQYVNEHRCIDWKCNIENRLVSKLKESGYLTVGLPAIGHGFQDEFDEYSIDAFGGREQLLDGSNLYDNFIEVYRNNQTDPINRYLKYLKTMFTDASLVSYINGIYKFYNRKVRDEILLNWQDFGTNKRIDQIQEQISSNENTFIFSNLIEPHFPYKPTKFVEEYLPKSCTKKDIRRALKTSFPAATLQDNELDSQNTEILKALYDAEIKYTDEQIGRLYDFLAETGALEETALIVTADHGDTIGKQGVYGHRGEMVDDIMEIPMLAHYPDGNSDNISDYVEFKDLYTHLQDIANGDYAPMTGRGYAICEYYGHDTQNMNLFENYEVDENYVGRYQVTLYKQGERYYYSSLDKEIDLEPPLNQIIKSPVDEYQKYRNKI